MFQLGKTIVSEDILDNHFVCNLNACKGNCCVEGEAGATPLIDGRACVYATFNKDGMVLCGIEQAYKDDRVDFYKPISCHLYPIRIKEYKSMTAVNYHSWPICHDACLLGDQLKVPVYRFVKEALIRKFGQSWYKELDEMAKDYYDSKLKKS